MSDSLTYKLSHLTLCKCHMYIFGLFALPGGSWLPTLSVCECCKVETSGVGDCLKSKPATLEIACVCVCVCVCVCLVCVCVRAFVCACIFMFMLLAETSPSFLLSSTPGSNRISHTSHVPLSRVLWAGCT